MEEKIYFKNSRGNSLCGILSNPTSNRDKPIIILCHGLSSSKEGRTASSLQEVLNRQNISTFRFDFFGHGESEGKIEDITISEAVDDILSAIALLKERGYSKIGLVGSSFGGIGSIVAASRSNDIYVLALKSPVSNYQELEIAKMGEEGIKIWKETGYTEFDIGDGEILKINYTFFEDSRNNNGYEAAKKIKVPTLIVHGDADDVVPVKQSEKIAKLIENCRLEILQGVDHDYSRREDFERVLNLISEFIIENSY